jgi:hypothetical protein
MLSETAINHLNPMDNELYHTQCEVWKSLQRTYASINPSELSSEVGPLNLINLPYTTSPRLFHPIFDEFLHVLV